MLTVPPDCIIFLIDAQKSMFLQNDRGEIPFENALKCAIATLTDKIISSENDLVGVCFYGTVPMSFAHMQTILFTSLCNYTGEKKESK